MQLGWIVSKEELEKIVSEIVSSVVEEIKNAHPPTREVMTLRQLADYWQVTRQSILNWSRREHYRLPIHYVGGDPRFHLSEVNIWSKEEAMRKLEVKPVR